jgi:hypothetical protein
MPRGNEREGSADLLFKVCGFCLTTPTSQSKGKWQMANFKWFSICRLPFAI